MVTSSVVEEVPGDDMVDFEVDETPDNMDCPAEEVCLDDVDDPEVDGDEDGDGELAPRPVDLRAAGTLRLMFSSASLRSAWKSGWRKVQLCG